MVVKAFLMELQRQMRHGGTYIASTRFGVGSGRGAVLEDDFVPGLPYYAQFPVGRSFFFVCVFRLEQSWIHAAFFLFFYSVSAAIKRYSFQGYISTDLACATAAVRFGALFSCRLRLWSTSIVSFQSLSSFLSHNVELKYLFMVGMMCNYFSC